MKKNTVQEVTWEELLLEARNAGLNCDEVRDFLKKEKPTGGKKKEVEAV
ncbi:DNA-binding anti-repressor SinI [Alkalicoccus saliphilus]|jgi:hypothetical protein|uniref:Sin domain-containing protein n=1 Tax=Alkalicoccus saliphilus TaxID=200989 RepID=A0A2T4U7B3_9BACI|nr:DNA-binding anti-repressor SinI [Alkalicoccus saliphilus]PTL39293.1 hypothetical protein C6Y45_06685 [Alkalicoccus saliphilus]